MSNQTPRRHLFRITLSRSLAERANHSRLGNIAPTEIAAALNVRGIRTARGGRWHVSNVKNPQRGVITKSVGGTRVAQLVSTALRTSKKSRTMFCAHALADGDGLPNATCATLGI